VIKKILAGGKHEHTVEEKEERKSQRERREKSGKGPLLRGGGEKAAKRLVNARDFDFK
jgi:hypothetical protein